MRSSSGAPGPLCVKPRAIIQVEPEFLADATAQNHSISAALHELWHPSCVYEVPHHTGITVPVRFVYASGYTQAMLNAAYQHMLDDSASWYWVAGDDNLTCVRCERLCLHTWYEGDFSRYDSTQGAQALSADVGDVTALGFDPEIAAIDAKGRECVYVVVVIRRHFRYRIKFRTGPQQSSGLGSTTWGNSSRNVKNGVHTFYYLGARDPETAAADLGFQLKLRVHPEPRYLTFLKGWWVPTRGGEAIWLPLPSMILKIGKSLRSPQDLFPLDDIATAYRKTAYALASSPGLVPYDYPILGPFIDMMKTVGIENDFDMPHKWHRIRIETPQDVALDLDAIYDMLAYRYEISRDEVDEFHRLIGTIASFPVVFPDSGVPEKLYFDYA